MRRLGTWCAAGVVTVSASGVACNAIVGNDDVEPASSAVDASADGAGHPGDTGGSDAPTVPRDGGGGDVAVPDGASPDGPDAASDIPTTCAEAAANPSYVGCEFWPTVTANIVWSIFDYAVVVANPGSAPATVTVTGNGMTQQTVIVQPGQLSKVYLPWVPALKGPDADNCGVPPVPEAQSVTAVGGAYHLTSTTPVAVYQFNALEFTGVGGPAGKSWASCPGNTLCTQEGITVGCYSFTNDASLLLPTSALTGTYRVAGIPNFSVQGNLVTPSYFTVTATADDTHVTAALVAGATATPFNGTDAGSVTGTLSVTLNAGDVTEIFGTGASDLSGSLVTADHPVQVMTGNPCIAMPQATGGSCDHVEESMMPAETLGKHYVVTQPTGPVGNVPGHDVRFYGNVDGTQLLYSPARPPACPVTLNAGQVVDCGTVSADFEVTGDQPFVVASFSLSGGLVDPNPEAGSAMSEGDPAQTIVPPVEQYKRRYVFLAPNDYPVGYADIVTTTGASLVLDGSPLSATFTAIGTNGYGVYRVKLDPSQGGAHILFADQPMGVQISGDGLYTSYYYPGGYDLAKIAAPPTH